ncbi:MAG: hypothetical protein U0798_18320 [Gemmataceae bacterium]
MAVPAFAAELRRRGHGPLVVKKLTFDNPLHFWRQSNNWTEPVHP